MDDKIIVSNRSALTRKVWQHWRYEGQEAAIASLIAADAKRGIKTGFVYLDEAAAMKRFKAAP